MQEIIHIYKKDIQELLNKGLTRIQMAERIQCGVCTLDKWMKRHGLKYLGNTYFYAGDKNPAKRKNVREKISNSVAMLWEKGYYAERINGMKEKTGFNHPRYNGPRLPYAYNPYLKKYQDIKLCHICGNSGGKIDIHHVDEDKENWLITNLIPLCVGCHQKKHYKTMKLPYVTLSLKAHFDAEHHLLNYKGKCARSHGHRYNYEIFIRDRIDGNGFVSDFVDIKNILKKSIEETLDHTSLNNIVSFNPTAEHLALWLFEFLSKRFLLKGLKKILLWETPNCKICVTDKDMLRFFRENRILEVSYAKS